MAELKIGRQVFDITKNDVVIFNGACWQLMSRTVRSGWYDCHPTVSKTLSYISFLSLAEVFKLSANCIE